MLEQPDVDLRSVTGALAGRPWLPVARTGLLELFGPASGALGAARLVSSAGPGRAAALGPASHEPAGDFADRRSASVRDRTGGGGPAAAQDAAACRPPAARLAEAWSLLPADERLTDDRRYLRFDGTPALAATTFERIGLLAKKRFRLFVLGKDRSRKGSAPVLAFETDCPLWYPLDVTSVNAVGDLSKDLVLVHPGGLRGKELQVTVYRGLGRENSIRSRGAGS